MEGVACVKKEGRYGYIRNPLPGDRQEKYLEDGGLLVGEVVDVSQSDVLVKRSANAEKTASNSESMP